MRLNRVVALVEVAGVRTALSKLEALDARLLAGFQPYHAVRADLLRRLGRAAESAAAYDAALALAPGKAERLWLQQRRPA